MDEADPPPVLSVVVPLHDEQETVDALHARLSGALGGWSSPTS